MLNYYYPIIIMLIIILVLFIEQKKKIKRYWVFKNIKRNEAIKMLEIIKLYINRSVIVETISSKYYGKLEEVNDEYIVINGASNEKDIIKIEFIVAVSISKLKKNRKNED